MSELTTAGKPPVKLDYSLTGVNASLAVEKGLAEADWYQCPIPRATLRKLLERRDGPALRDTVIWLALILGSAWATWELWGTGWAILTYALYAVLYGSTSDSRWHEAGHYLKSHPNLPAVEFYLCGPPMMMKACVKMLADLGVRPEQIACDEF